MATQNRDVQKLDVHPLDAIRAALRAGLNRLRVRIQQRRIKLNVWTGTFEAQETVTTLESTNERD